MGRDKQIFVSHSQHDKDYRRAFLEVFGLAGIQAKCMEFEAIRSPAWNEIKNQISNSKAVFVLLGPNVLSSSHTKNWVAFEIGLACALGKHVWVFEQSSTKLDFPIPYLTDYMFNVNLEDR